MKIDAVYLLAHRYYLRLTRICVAGIRHWHPDIPTYLIKDEVAGRFSTEEIERHWNVGVMANTDHAFGWTRDHGLTYYSLRELEVWAMVLPEEEEGLLANFSAASHAERVPTPPGFSFVMHVFRFVPKS